LGDQVERREQDYPFLRLCAWRKKKRGLTSQKAGREENFGTDCDSLSSQRVLRNTYLGRVRKGEFDEETGEKNELVTLAWNTRKIRRVWDNGGEETSTREYRKAHEPPQKKKKTTLAPDIEKGGGP